MADHSMYHSIGQGEQYDPNDPNRNTQPAPQQFQPPVAQNPYQPGYGSQAMAQPYGSPSPVGPPGFQPPAGQVPPHMGDGGLAGQMAGMNLGDGQSTLRKKKKDRHAYHTVEAPAGSSQAFNGMPPAGTPATPYLNAEVGHSQFPAPVNAPFNPMSQASPAEFAARSGQPESAPSPAFVPAAGGPGGQVSADDIPSVPISRDGPQQHYLSNIYPTFERHVPPPATVSFVAFDQGNSSPKYTRLTMNSIPASSEGLNSTGLPLGLLLQPLAPLQPGEAQVPLLDFGEQGPPRCRRCRAYINPFMMFRSGGGKFVCNLCTYPNDTPSEYFCATTPQGVRVDRDQRPELSRGTVEFTVPKEYWTKEPTGLHWLFAIDVTQESYNKGFLEAFCEGVLSALYAPEGQEEDENGEPIRRIPPGVKVGFVTYDKDIHFYNCNVCACYRRRLHFLITNLAFSPLSSKPR